MIVLKRLEQARELIASQKGLIAKLKSDKRTLVRRLDRVEERLSILRAVSPSIEKTVDHFEALRKRYRGATVSNAGKVRLREIA